MSSKEKKKKLSLRKFLRGKALLSAKLILIVFVAMFWLGFYVKWDVLTDNRYHNLWVHGPSIVEADEVFAITVEVWDKFERLVGAYKGEVQIELESYQLNTTGYYLLGGVNWSIESSDLKFTSNHQWGAIYPAYLVAGANNGKKSFNVSISTPGVHYFRVTDVESGDSFRSNPIMVKPKGSTFTRLYWGDIHAHSYYSDGSGHPTEVYHFARDVALLDFAALTDHAETFPQMSTMALFDKFEDYIRITNSFNQEGKFVTIVALEWTPLLGGARSYLAAQHTNFYFRGDSMPFFSTFTHFTPDEIYSYLSRNTDGEFMAWTHHVLRSDYGADFGFYNESINRMIEIYSEHGSGETTNLSQNPYPTIHSFSEEDYGYSVQDMLRMGYKCGLMASSDSHDGRMGHNIVHTKARGAVHVHPLSIAGYNLGAYPGGLTGVFADVLNRTQIYDAIYSRSAYATTWVNRHFMNFTINGVMIGQQDSTVQVPTVNTTRILEITIITDGISLAPGVRTNISKIEIFKNSELWKTEIINDIIYHQIIQDNATITGTSYDHCIQKADGNWYIHEASIQPVDPATLNTNGADYYYVRMTDTNGRLGWIGPIWVAPGS
ncbi:MAG: DUF3604 domain-containing protein [Promethearchaeota archaeon]|nr:MAG: DUF3604 domain-containing protein [Candidatus Lokiarchaeota archaeon]